MTSFIEIENALKIFKTLNVEFTNENICKLDNDKKRHYEKLLNNFKTLNKIRKKSPEAPPNLHNLKGKALEDLVSYLLEISGDLFKVDSNLRNSTNEIDQLISLSPMGSCLLKNGLINPKLQFFLGECKNYDKPVSVTYLGKFCSLLISNNVRLGIMFSYYGVSGKGWKNGSGLIRKFYMHKEEVSDRYCIINFSIKEFESILKGENLLQIINNQITSLQFDTDYSRYKSKHPAE